MLEPRWSGRTVSDSVGSAVSKGATAINCSSSFKSEEVAVVAVVGVLWGGRVLVIRQS